MRCWQYYLWSILISVLLSMAFTFDSIHSRRVLQSAIILFSENNHKCNIDSLHFGFSDLRNSSISLSEVSRRLFSSIENVFSGTKKSCFYQNRDLDVDEMISINLSDNVISGFINSDGQLYIIPEQRLLKNGSLLFQLSGNHHQLLSNGLITNKNKMRRKKRSIFYNDIGTQETNLYVEIYLVLDHTVYTTFNRDRRAAEDYGANIVNYVNSLYRQIGLHVMLVKIDIWTENNLVSNYSNLPDMKVLQAFREQTMFSVMKHDNAQFILNYTNDTTGGEGFVSGMCGSYSLGYSKFDKDSLWVSLIMAHELGHNIGLQHINTSGTCFDHGCIMGPTQSHIAKHGWTPTSLSKVSELLKDVHLTRCLQNRPQRLARPTMPVCGNGIVEIGEECDSGMMEKILPTINYNLTITCCNITTCTFLPNAKCSSGRCCNQTTCQIRPQGDVCSFRVSIGECDLPEYCDGVSERCPSDLYKLDGTLCHTKDKIPFTLAQFIPNSITKPLQCESGLCVIPTKLMPPRPSQCSCSDLGVCNNMFQCHCNDGRAGPQCDTVGCGGSLNSGPACAAKEDLKIIGILVLVLVVIFVFFGISLMIAVKSGKLFINPEDIMKRSRTKEEVKTKKVITGKHVCEVSPTKGLLLQYDRFSAKEIEEKNRMNRLLATTELSYQRNGNIITNSVNVISSIPQNPSQNLAKQTPPPKPNKTTPMILECNHPTTIPNNAATDPVLNSNHISVNNIPTQNIVNTNLDTAKNLPVISRKQTNSIKINKHTNNPPDISEPTLIHTTMSQDFCVSLECAKNLLSSDPSKSCKEAENLHSIHPFQHSCIISDVPVTQLPVKNNVLDIHYSLNTPLSEFTKPSLPLRSPIESSERLTENDSLL